jgi:transcriptional regulator with XRE-family HTH domain
MKNLKFLRTKQKLSQQELANILHVSQQSIYKYENGITTPDVNTLIDMADFFHTSIDYLVGYSTIPHKIEPVTETSLNKQELAVIENYRKLSTKNLTLIETLIAELAKK